MVRWWKEKKQENIEISRINLVLIMLISLWIKTIVVYFSEFRLGVATLFQMVICLLNPLIASMLFGLVLLIKKDKNFKIGLFVVSTLLTILLISNLYYYREFSDYLTVDTVLKTGSVIGGLNDAVAGLFKWYDVFYLTDIVLLLGYYGFLYKESRKNKIGKVIGGYNKWKDRAFITFSVSISLLVVTLAEIDRPQLLTRGFDNNYMVKYLGLPSFFVKSGVDSYKVRQLRAYANPSDLEEIEEVLNKQHGEDGKNNQYFGKLKGKNVIYIHLESFQQFTIDYKIRTEDGRDVEVTPNLNKIFHSMDTMAFSNIYHQVGQGKTSDAEIMIDTGLFGVEQGSAMVKYAGENTFYGMPAILYNKGYETSVFHGNTATFWNRNKAYKKLGYQNFYSLEKFKEQEVHGYGIKDEDFFNESYEIYEGIESPKYTKFIPVSNHFPYLYDYFDSEIPDIDVSDETINGYFKTANYMDAQIGNFLSKFSDEELENTVIILYGDHYAHSNSRNPELGKFLYNQQKLKGETDESEAEFNWKGIDNVFMQKVPVMIYSKGSNLGEGGINEKLGGQIDIYPTLLNLMGIENTTVSIGRDLLANTNRGYVVFRDGTVVMDDKVYYKGAWVTLDGEKIDIDRLDEADKEELTDVVVKAEWDLASSDKIMIQNLLSLNGTDFKKEIENYNY